MTTLRNVKTRGTADHQAKEAAYDPTTPADWVEEPVDVAEALDAMAAHKGEHHLVFFASAVGIKFDETGIILGPAVDLLTSNTTLTQSHEIVHVDASGGAVTIKPPAASTYNGPGYSIKKIDSSANAVIISEIVDGVALAILNMQYDSVTVNPRGTEWWIR